LADKILSELIAAVPVHRFAVNVAYAVVALFSLAASQEKDFCVLPNALGKYTSRFPKVLAVDDAPTLSPIAATVDGFDGASDVAVAPLP